MVAENPNQEINKTSVLFDKDEYIQNVFVIGGMYIQYLEMETNKK